MYDIEIKRMFSAAHQLRGYNGKCQNMHGHNYAVMVTVRAEKLDEIGMALDFTLLKKALDELLEAYDHHNLSELPDFKEINPTSENLARTIFAKLAPKINGNGAKLLSVKIGESENSAVTYFE